MELVGLSFAPGEKVQADATRALNLPISCPNPSFALVAAFGRCKFRLDSCSVSLILQATIGGSAHHFRTSLLANRTFKFFVSCKQIGFFITNLRSFSCDQYFVSFHLWGNGGPNWGREFNLFLLEEERSWHSARKQRNPSSRPHAQAFTRKGVSFADAVKVPTPPILSGANAIPVRPQRDPTSSSSPAVPHFQLTGANAIPVRPLDQPFSSRPTDKPAFVHPSSSSAETLPLSGANAVPIDRSKSTFQTGSLENSRDRAPTPFCPRCLSFGHYRHACQRPIKCRACSNWGHIESNCRNLNQVNKHDAGSSKILAAHRVPFGWFKDILVGPTASVPPPTFSSFAEMVRALNLNYSRPTRGMCNWLMLLVGLSPLL